MENYIDIKKLSLDELAGVVNLYPWFGSARKELCERMSRMGGDVWGDSRYADAAMYVASRKIISDMARAAVRNDWSDKDVQAVIRSYISEQPGQVAVREKIAGNRPSVRVAGGDFFSQSEYEKVRKEEDGVFTRFASAAREEMSPTERHRYEELDFCTETLAQIYAEQGYYEHAKSIYTKLILAYPEKNTYFAALIEKLDMENQKIL